MGLIDRRLGGGHDMNHYVCYKKIDGNWILFNDHTVQYQKSIGSFHRIHLAFYRKLSTTEEYGIGLEDLSHRQSKRSKKATGNLCSFNYITIIFYEIKLFFCN